MKTVMLLMFKLERVGSNVLEQLVQGLSLSGYLLSTSDCAHREEGYSCSDESIAGDE